MNAFIIILLTVIIYTGLQFGAIVGYVKYKEYRRRKRREKQWFRDQMIQY